MECVILMGLPGAGKTTFYHAFLSGTHQHISKDLWPTARNRDARQRVELQRALAEGRSTVIDNVTATVAERTPLIAIAKAHGARVIGYYFAVTTREAVARNADRQGRNRVPNVAIFSAARRFEPPRMSEGFDQLFRMELSPDRTFHVVEMSR